MSNAAEIVRIPYGTAPGLLFETQQGPEGFPNVIWIRDTDDGSAVLLSADQASRLIDWLAIAVRRSPASSGGSEP
jgi:hypothetical protein